MVLEGKGNPSMYCSFLSDGVCISVLQVSSVEVRGLALWVHVYWGCIYIYIRVVGRGRHLTWPASHKQTTKNACIFHYLLTSPASEQAWSIIYPSQPICSVHEFEEGPARFLRQIARGR